MWNCSLGALEEASQEGKTCADRKELPLGDCGIPLWIFYLNLLNFGQKK